MKKQHLYLTEEEVQFIRNEINKLRVPGSYESGKWSVSHYNRRSEVTGGKYPKSIVLRDITLRTAEQVPVVSLDLDERLRLAEALLEAGIRSLQINWTLGALELADTTLVKHIRKLIPNVELTIDTVTSKEQIDSIAEAGINLAQFQNPAIPAMTPIYLPEIYAMAWRGEDWRKKYRIRTAEDQIEWASELINYAKKLGVKTSAGVNMLAYSTVEYLERYCSAMARAEVDYISLYDGSGGMGPEAWEYVVSLVKRVAPQPQIAVHPHNDFGLAVANCLTAVKGGAHVIEVSVNGLCSASGQADIAEVAAALEVLYGVDTGIRLEKLTSLSRLVEDMTRVKMSQKKPITGERVYGYNGDGRYAEIYVDPLLHYCAEPSIFGNKKPLFIGKVVSRWAVLLKLQELGVEISRELIPQVHNCIRAEISIRKRVLSDEEIYEIATKLKASTEK